MTKYQLRNGKETDNSDSDRLIWYASGNCGYWTDDWEKIGRTGNYEIPCCPHCNAVGFQDEYNKYIEGAIIFQKAGNPHYLEFLMLHKELCIPDKNFIDRYIAFELVYPLIKKYID
jgi:hypothetical protein